VAICGNAVPAISAITTALALALGVSAAYGLARFPVPGKGALLLALIAGTAFPQIATVSPLYLLMRALELRDTWLALIQIGRAHV